MSKAFVILFMLFCHIVDDYYLQGWLASAKQKKWWQENAPDKLYRHDYIIALVMHSLSWSFMIMLPVAIYYGFNVGGDFVWLFIGNAIIHAMADNSKANLLSINLIIDQIIHVSQVFVTALLMLFELNV